MKPARDQIVIRTLKTADAAAYLKLRLYGLRESPSAFGASFAEERNRSVKECGKWLGVSPQKEVFVGAFAGPGMVGQAALRRERTTNRKQRHKAWLWGMYVHPRFRGLGVGCEIVERLLQAAQVMKGLLFVKLGVTATNAPAITLYRHLGFRHYATEPKALRVNGRFYDFEYMMIAVPPKKSGGPRKSKQQSTGS